MKERSLSSAIFMRSSALLRISRDLRVGTVRSSLVNRVARVANSLANYRIFRQDSTRTECQATNMLHDLFVCIHFKCAPNFGEAQPIDLRLFGVNPG